MNPGTGSSRRGCPSWAPGSDPGSCGASAGPSTPASSAQLFCCGKSRETPPCPPPAGQLPRYWWPLAPPVSPASSGPSFPPSSTRSPSCPALLGPLPAPLAGSSSSDVTSLLSGVLPPALHLPAPFLPQNFCGLIASRVQTQPAGSPLPPPPPVQALTPLLGLQPSWRCPKQSWASPLPDWGSALPAARNAPAPLGENPPFLVPPSLL